MKKIITAIVTIVLLCAVAFLSGEWPETATRSRVLLCDGVALFLVAVCSLYLYKVKPIKHDE